MTVSDLIKSVLSEIRKAFYAQSSIRIYMRDHAQLTKSVARYGFECNRRGWEFEPQFIADDLTKLLRRINESGTEFEYFPVYLEHAVDGHIRNRAEELSAKAKLIGPRVKELIDGVKPVVMVEKKTVEVLSDLYRELHNASRTKRAPAQGKQMKLL